MMTPFSPFPTMTTNQNPQDRDEELSESANRVMGEIAEVLRQILDSQRDSTLSKKQARFFASWLAAKFDSLRGIAEELNNRTGAPLPTTRITALSNMLKGEDCFSSLGYLAGTWNDFSDKFTEALN
jgi:hypothetical protein